jgi:hypothetical protein
VAAVVAIVVAITVVVVTSGGGSSTPRAAAGRQMQSIFQDDLLLIDSPTATVEKTLQTLRGLGVDRVRATVLWLSIAPDGTLRKPPKHFHAGDPNDYPAAGWAPYDRLVELAGRDGIAVDFNVTAPGPRWAMVQPAPSAKLASHYRPSPSAFGQFVAAVGRRYSGRWPATAGSRTLLPRVSFWTIWNEPNQPGWLAPQWRGIGAQRAMDAPRLYRLYVAAGFAALRRTGHTPATDTILVGELAPEGTEGTADETPIPPLSFLRALYCVGDSYQPLRGPQTGALHCPAGGSPSAFVKANPGLFDVTGFAHHPYSFFLAPNVPIGSDPNFAPLASLGALESALDRIFAAYGVHRRLPIYLTEYGYESKPPNPFRGVKPALQAAYLDEAQYMAWKDPRVRSMAQFLLVDSAPNTADKPGTIGYWSTFQTGLEYLGGRHKPAFAAYRLPIWIPQPTVARGAALFVWAMLRLAPNDTTQQAEVQWAAARVSGAPGAGGKGRARGSGAGAEGGRARTYRTLATVTTNDPDGFLTARVHVPGSGRVRVAWRSASGRTFHSRAVAVTVSG